MTLDPLVFPWNTSQSVFRTSLIHECWLSSMFHWIVHGRRRCELRLCVSVLTAQTSPQMSHKNNNKVFLMDSHNVSPSKNTNNDTFYPLTPEPGEENPPNRCSKYTEHNIRTIFTVYGHENMTTGSRSSVLKSRVQEADVVQVRIPGQDFRPAGVLTVGQEGDGRGRQIKGSVYRGKC